MNILISLPNDLLSIKSLRANDFEVAILDRSAFQAVIQGLRNPPTQPVIQESLLDSSQPRIQGLLDLSDQPSIQGVKTSVDEIKYFSLSLPEPSFKIQDVPIQFNLYKSVTEQGEKSFERASLSIYKRTKRFNIGDTVFLKTDITKKGIVKSRILNSWLNDFYYIQWSDNPDSQILHPDDDLRRIRYIPQSYYRFQEYLANHLQNQQKP